MTFVLKQRLENINHLFIRVLFMNPPWGAGSVKIMRERGDSPYKQDLDQRPAHYGGLLFKDRTILALYLSEVKVHHLSFILFYFIFWGEAFSPFSTTCCCGFTAKLSPSTHLTEAVRYDTGNQFTCPRRSR